MKAPRTSKPPSTNKHLIRWVEKMAELDPACDASIG